MRKTQRKIVLAFLSIGCGSNPEIILRSRKAGREAWTRRSEATHVSHLEHFPACLPRPDFITLEVSFQA